MREDIVPTDDIIREDKVERTVIKKKPENKDSKAKGKGGRPKVAEKKDKPVTSYFTEKELEDLAKFIEDSPYPITLSTFVRTSALEKMNEGKL